MPATSQPLERYREMHVTSATPLQRVLMAYDVAILACTRRDLKKTTDALNVLRDSLDLDQGPVAWGLFRLYMYCADLARANKYDEAANVLRELVQAWVEILVKAREARPRVAASQAIYASA